MYLIGASLLVIDCLVIAVWIGGFTLLALGELHGVAYLVHSVIVLMTALAQIVWKFRCPLIIWRNRVIGSDDVLNPHLIKIIEGLFRVEWSTANKMLSGIILLGATFYILVLIRTLM